MNQSQVGQIIKLMVPEDFKELSLTFGRQEAGPMTIEIAIKVSDHNCPTKVSLKRPTSTQEDDSVTEPKSEDLNQQPVQAQASSSKFKHETALDLCKQLCDHSIKSWRLVWTVAVTSLVWPLCGVPPTWGATDWARNGGSLYANGG
ncbi:uncharacterized protein BJ212DRAFT_1304338 [Suillus subaureus]|uniref:Uncharacterized protein n=1 Tax=Suillus subaureus TaxID=48587 RepID=A0A9P7DW19_9AGAM|nr:uncharacterized protein BJ212DRAFT_1304338 [Suillus subaureus]KAG1804317.1 hypothetical protein BJ212DRAFT_1304338 [Suillus subaureus]